MAALVIRAATATLLLVQPACSRSTPLPAPSFTTVDTLVLMGTTDVHGWLLPYDYYRGEATDHGLAMLLPLVDSIRAEHPGRTALFDSGDILQGTPLAFVHSRLDSAEVHPIVLAMNRADYDAAAIGNHEFNYGIEHLDQSIDKAEFPFVSANIFRFGTSEHAYRPYTILERRLAGHILRIGVTAATPPGVLLWDRDNVRGRLEFRDVVESVRSVVGRMRDEGADIVVVASHGGLDGSSYDTSAMGVPAENAAAAMAREIPGIDVIFMGHTHREVTDTTIAGTLLVQAKNWAASLAVVELEVASSPDGGWQVVSKRGKTLRPEARTIDPELAALLTQADARTRAYVNREIGTSTAEWSAAAARTRDTPILDLINTVQREATGADLSSTAAFSLSARIPEGPVTVADIAGLYVYDNTLKAIRISGADLRAYLENSAEYYLPCPAAGCTRITNPEIPGYNFDVVSGVEYTLDLTRPIGERVVRLEFRGRPVASADSFTLAVNNYRAGGSGGFTMLADAPVVYDRGEGIRELLIAEIMRQGTFSPEEYFRENWRIVPHVLAERARAEQNPAAHR